MVKSNTQVLIINDLSVAHGKIISLSHVNLEVKRGELVALIGANGAGKSTLLKAVLGIHQARSGTISFMGRDITRMSVDRIVASGIAIIPEGRAVLQEMTVAENLELGAYYRKDNIQDSLEQVFHLFPVLRERKGQKARVLSGGEQQMLAIARAMMANPELIMMDEPSLGLAPVLVNQVFDVIINMKEQGYTILLAEQNARKALGCADRGYVFELGKIVLGGTAEELRNNDQVRQAYLGGS